MLNVVDEQTTESDFDDYVGHENVSVEADNCDVNEEKVGKSQIKLEINGFSWGGMTSISIGGDRDHGAQNDNEVHNEGSSMIRLSFERDDRNFERSSSQGR